MLLMISESPENEKISIAQLHTRINNAEAAYSVIFSTSSPQIHIVWNTKLTILGQVHNKGAQVKEYTSSLAGYLH